MKPSRGSVVLTVSVALMFALTFLFPGCGSKSRPKGTDGFVPGDGPPPQDAVADGASSDAAGSDGAPSDASSSDAAGPDGAVPTACTPYPCPPNAHCYEENGLVHAPTPANQVHRLSYVPPAGTYTRFRLEMDVYHGGWATDPAAIRHNLFWLARDERNFDMIGYGNFEKPSTVHMVHGFGMVHGDKPKLRTNASLPEYDTYHISYIYDPGNQVVSMTVTRQGNPVATLSDVPNVTSIQFSNNMTIDVDFGFEEGLNDAEPPTYGWEYRDVCLQVIP